MPKEIEVCRTTQGIQVDIKINWNQTFTLRLTEEQAKALHKQLQVELYGAE